MKTGFSSSVLICIVVSGILITGGITLPSVRASSVRGPGNVTPDCVYQRITLVFRIYQGMGTITFSGNTYSNGGSVVVNSGCHAGYAISKGSISNNYRFFQWLSDAGSFANAISESTTFTPSGGGTHSVAMVIDLPNNLWSTWGGFTMSGTNINQASGTFQLPCPTCVSWVQGGSYGPIDYVHTWIGIGGNSPTANLWQASIMMNTSSSGTTLVALYEYVDTTAHYKWDTSSVSPYLQLGDTITISLAYSGGYSSVSLCDTTRSRCWNPPAVHFTPDTTSAEWVMEDGGGCTPGCYLIPNFGYVTFSSASTPNYPYLAAPLLHRTGLGGQWGCGFFQTCRQFMDSNIGGYDYVYGWSSFVDRYAFTQG